ncbi:MAG: RNA polymerase sigma factor [Prevotella sp.]
MRNISFRNDVMPLKDVLYRLALRITLNREEAEDIVQDTLIKVWNKRDEWQDIKSIEAYSLTICRNLSLDRIKRAGNDTQPIKEGEHTDSENSINPYERIVQKDSIEQVKHIIDGLPEKQKSCMQLRDFEGKSYKDIANILEISEEQVKINIFRARQTVKKQFKEIDKYGL